MSFIIFLCILWNHLINRLRKKDITDDSRMTFHKMLITAVSSLIWLACLWYKCPSQHSSSTVARVTVVSLICSLWRLASSILDSGLQRTVPSWVFLRYRNSVEWWTVRPSKRSVPWFVIKMLDAEECKNQETWGMNQWSMHPSFHSLEIEKWRKESRSPRFQHLSFVHHDTAGQRPKKDRESMLGNIEKLQLQKRRLRRKRPSKRWKKCNPVRKKKRQL